MDKKRFQEEVGELYRIFQSIQQNEGVVVVCFLLEATIKAQHLSIIKKQLSNEISQLLSADWEAEEMLIAGTTASVAHDLVIDVEVQIH